jgi:hypothetical protein
VEYITKYFGPGNSPPGPKPLTEQKVKEGQRYMSSVIVCASRSELDIKRMQKQHGLSINYNSEREPKYALANDNILMISFRGEKIYSCS